MIYSSFHMTQDVAIAILPRIGRIGVLRLFYFYHGFNGLDGAELLNSLNPLTGSKTKTKKNPLVRMEGVALMLCFRLGLIRASS